MKRIPFYDGACGSRDLFFVKYAHAACCFLISTWFSHYFICISESLTCFSQFSKRAENLFNENLLMQNVCFLLFISLSSFFMKYEIKISDKVFAVAENK